MSLDPPRYWYDVSTAFRAFSAANRNAMLAPAPCSLRELLQACSRPVAEGRLRRVVLSIIVLMIADLGGEYPGDRLALANLCDQVAERIESLMEPPPRGARGARS